MPSKSSPRRLRHTCFRLGSLLLSGLGTAAGLSAQTPQVFISEFMASNFVTRADYEGDSPDWIELFNQGSSTVDLGGWFLTDAASKPGKWQFPKPTLLAAGSRLLVFASGKDRLINRTELHTSFKLSSGGEYLALLDARQNTIDHFAPRYPPQFPDIAYGRVGTAVGYLPQATPGGANSAIKPIFGQVSHHPLAPTTTTPIVVQAELLRDAKVAVSKVTMFYRRSYGYERSVAMRDDGLGGDKIAGDDIWTGVIPSGIPAGRQVRWRVQATHTLGGARRPLFRSAKNSPQYFGTRVQDPSVSSQLPILYWWASSPANATSAWGSRCSVFYRGQFYENVFVRRRGNSSSGWPKPNLKFDFNSGYHLRHDASLDDLEEFNVNSTWSDKSFVRQVLGFETYEQAGVHGGHAEPLRMQLNGQFYSVGIFVEQADKRMLKRLALDPRGALYKMFNTLVSGTAGVEKKTRKWENHSDLTALVNGVALTGAARERYLYDNVDLPAVINYIAATVLMHDQDHVHKNHYLYRDSEGDREWRFLPWDKDLTFGRNYFTQYGVLNDILWADVDPASHPLFGDQPHRNPGAQWNRLIHACHATPRIRAMFLRRLRSLMDAILQPPGVVRSQLAFEARIDGLKARMRSDVGLDRTRWGVPNYGDRSIGFAKGLSRLENLYLIPRRKHLFQKHSSAATGIIPSAQANGLPLVFGQVVPSTAAPNPDQAFLELVNCNPLAIDISGWVVKGGIEFAFTPGTVIPAGEALYLAARPRAFRARSSGPRGGQRLLVVGPYAGTLQAGASLRIFDGLRLVTSVGGFAYQLSTTGQGDLDIQIAGAAPGAELFHLISTQTNHRLGCGPLLGLGSDALWAATLPLGTQPFHVLADGFGSYRFQAPPSTVARGLILDSLVVAFNQRTGQLLISPAQRTRF